MLGLWNFSRERGQNLRSPRLAVGSKVRKEKPRRTYHVGTRWHLPPPEQLAVTRTHGRQPLSC